ncbi:MAG: hypothetical protein NWE89_17465 [Candidatus Bathyarchaeota archaeon]|nr:hypothetical protein [Candidatus Bathyarchaeota archaeon]
MVDKSLKLTGILLVSSYRFNTYRVIHLYRAPKENLSAKIEVAVKTDKKMHIDYLKIERALGDAYGPYIRKIWRRRAWRNFQTYFQVHMYASPRMMKMKGDWNLWAQL